MSFTSYAQNFEDVVLWRALGHVGTGTYIDVGAQDPVRDSVSKGFYERGWRGIHVEPVPHFAQALQQDRPDETVLAVALSDTDGVLDLHVIPDTGLSTARSDYAEQHLREHGYAYQTVQVSALTMKRALAPLALGEVHWLKIDVEGFEEQVLRGWDSESLRPWVIVVEATIPMSSETSYAQVDEILVGARYVFRYFDGLNRFYTAAEHPELAHAFEAPPNVFDDFQLSGYSGVTRDLMALHGEELAEVRAALSSSEARCRAAEELQGRLDEALARAQDAEANAVKALAQAAEARQQMDEARSRAAWAEMQAAQAEARAAQAEDRSALAQAHASQAEQRQAQADARSVEAAHRTTQAEARAAEAAQRTTHAEARAAQEQARAASADRRAHDWELRAGASEQHARYLQERLGAVFASTSWRITRPVRALKDGLRRIRTSPRTAPARAIAKKQVVGMLRGTLSALNRFPSVKERVVHGLARVPGLESRLRAVAVQAAPSVPVAPVVEPAPGLSADAQYWYAELKKASKAP